MKKDQELVFQFASLGTTLELKNSLDHFKLMDSLDATELKNFWEVKNIEDVNEMWFNSHDHATHLFMSGFSMVQGENLIFEF